MQIRLNGERHDLDGPTTVAALLAALQIDPRRVAVEHNLVVVKRARYEDTIVKEGDEVEIVNFVGGGQGQSPINNPSIANRQSKIGNRHVL